jgi:hypothetical protein
MLGLVSIIIHKFCNIFGSKRHHEAQVHGHYIVKLSPTQFSKNVKSTLFYFYITFTADADLLLIYSIESHYFLLFIIH